MALARRPARRGQHRSGSTCRRFRRDPWPRCCSLGRSGAFQPWLSWQDVWGKTVGQLTGSGSSSMLHTRHETN